MKVNVKILTAILIATLVLVACSSPDNDPAVAAGVVTSAATMGVTPSTKSIGSKALISTGDFTGSSYATIAKTYANISTTLNGTVGYNGDTYSVNGTLNYAYSGTGSGITVYVYSPDGITISGPEYEGTVAVDFKATVTYSVTGSAYTMSVAVEGAVAGTKLNETLTFTYSAS